MKRKRFFLVIFAIAGILTACSNDKAIEPTNEQGHEISFRPQGGAPITIHRANANTRENIDGFAIYGGDQLSWFYYGKGTYSELMFNGIPVTRVPGNDPPVFDYSPKKYFHPLPDPALYGGTFAAYSPVGAKVSGVNIEPVSNSGTVNFTYTVPAPDSSGETRQEDLLVVYWNGLSPGGATIPLKFGHALSRIFVTATNSTSDQVIIKSLILKNLYSTGTCQPVDNDDIADWTNLGNVRDYKYILAESGINVSANTMNRTLVTSMEQGMMVIPQTLRSDFFLHVEYDFANLGASKAEIKLPVGYKFDAGKQYSINIAFTGVAINFTIDVKDFDDITDL